MNKYQPKPIKEGGREWGEQALGDADLELLGSGCLLFSQVSPWHVAFPCIETSICFSFTPPFSSVGHVELLLELAVGWKCFAVLKNRHAAKHREFKEQRMRTNKTIFIFAAKCLPASSLVILPLELEKPVSRKCACSLAVNSILFRSIWQFSSPLNNTTLHLYSGYIYIYIYVSSVDS